MIYYETYDKSYLKDCINSLSRLLPEDRIASLNIELASACNLNCSFCPSHKVQKYGIRRKGDGVMSSDIFERIAGDDSIIKPVKTLILHKDGESLLNKNIGKFIALAKKKSLAHIVTLTTNGILLSAQKLQELEKSGLDTITISIDAVAQYPPYGFKDSNNYNTLEKNVAAILSKKWKLKSINLSFINFTQKDYLANSLFLQKFVKYAENSKKINIIFNQYHNWSGSIENSGYKIDFPCDYPWYGMAVNYDGNVSVCCVDWNSDLLIGNVRTQTLGDIWRGSGLKKIRKIHLSGNLKSLPVCQKCTYKPYAHRKALGKWIRGNIKV